VAHRATAAHRAAPGQRLNDRTSTRPSACRASTAAEIAALALTLETSVPALFRADAEQIQLPEAAVSQEEYRAILP